MQNQINNNAQIQNTMDKGTNKDANKDANKGTNKDANKGTNKPIILVTGGTGLVGNAIRHVSQKYTDKWTFVFISSKMFDLTSLEQTQKMFETYKPTFVIHLAACVGGLFKNMNNKVEMLEKNLMINYNVVKSAHDYGVQKLIACLSTCIFPDKVEYPIDETDLHEGPPHTSNDAYAYAKRMLEIHCRAYRENYGDNFTCVIPTNIYGPHDNFDLEDGHVLPALIHKCFLAKRDNVDFVIRGSGAPLRQFIFSQDLAEIIMMLFSKDTTKDLQEDVIISVPEKDEISIGDVGRLIADAFEYGDRVVFDTNFSDGQYKKTVSIDRLRSILGDIEFTNIREGVFGTVEWFKKNYRPMK